MRFLIICFSFVFCFAARSAMAKDATPKELPQEVQKLLKKMENCNHWGGEEAYDEARAKEIAKAVSDLKCDSLDIEIKGTLGKYKNNSNVKSKIELAQKQFQ